MKVLRCGFSHQYTKLWGQTCARLLDVKRINRADIDDDAMDYDTEYFVGDLTQMFYALNDERLLRMVFIGNKGIPFTTYRSDTPEHFKKYADNIGKVFQIYVKE